MRKIILWNGLGSVFPSSNEYSSLGESAKLMSALYIYTHVYNLSKYIIQYTYHVYYIFICADKLILASFVYNASEGHRYLLLLIAEVLMVLHIIAESWFVTPFAGSHKQRIHIDYRVKQSIACCAHLPICFGDTNTWDFI